MKLIYRRRQGGKTYELVQWVKEGEPLDKYPGWSRVILTYTEQDAKRIRREYDLEYHQVYAYRDLRDMHGAHRHNFKVGVDNADLLLQQLLRDFDLTVATWTAAQDWEDPDSDPPGDMIRATES